MNDGMSFFNLSQRLHPLRRGLFIVASLVTLCIFLKVTFFSGVPGSIAVGATTNNRIPKALVVSTQAKDNVLWLREHLADWTQFRYVVDDPTSKYTVPKNKGREAMVYLTFMIDHYDELPEVMVFLHGDRYQWHNDDPLYDGVPMVQNLQVPYLRSQGYTNIRCVWTLGCPSELQGLNTPMTGDPKDEKSAENTQFNYPKAFNDLFPGKPLPSTVAVGCCAQFAVSKEKIHERPVEDYQHFRQWLLDTPLADHVSGRVLEYTWHIIFGQEAVHCPDPKICYCNVFGLCDLECTASQCGERWAYPPSASLPQGWPTVGWQGETRDQEALANMRKVAIVNQTTSSSLTSS